MKVFTKISGFMAVASVPALAFAQVVQPGGQLNNLIWQIGNLITNLIPIIIGLALLVFLWGVLVYVISKSQEDKDRARGFMIWGIIGLFVMVSVWGIVTVLSDAVFGGARFDSPPIIPDFTP